jgi:hypothetical protein
MVDIGLSGMKTDRTIMFEIERGNLGSTQVEVMNYLRESPLSIGTYNWSKIKAAPPNTYTFEVPATSLMELREVSADLGAIDVSNGLTHVGDQIGDGHTAPANIGGKEARVTVTNGSQSRYIYFQADHAFLEARRAQVVITVEYFDQGTGSEAWFNINYDSPGSDIESYYRNTRYIWLTNSGQWKTASFDLPDAYFGGRQNDGADFRISTSDRDLFVNTVTVTK